MDGSRINVDYLPEGGLEYSIDVVPTSDIVTQYLHGPTTRQYIFAISSINEYGSDVLQNISNSGFFENFKTWLETQSKAKNFPELPTGQKACKIEATTTGYLTSTTVDTGRYQIQCKILYDQEG